METMDRSPRSSAPGETPTISADLDRRLREALAPRPEAVERIVRRALAEGAGHAAPEPRRLLLPAVSLSAVLAIALALLVSVPPRPPQAGARVSISNVGSVFVARSARGKGWVIQSGEQSGEPGPSDPNEQILIVYGGDR